MRALVCLMLVLAGTSAAAENWNVLAGGSRLEFVPREIVIAPGDTVTFRNLGGVHNVMADNGAFRCARGCDGQGGNGAPSSQIWTATLRFDTPGRYGYFCEPHGAPGEGMYGTVIVAGGLPPPQPVPADGSLLRVLLAGLLLLSGAWLVRR